MSTEQDKDTLSLKRNRGGDGGLDGLAGPGALLGSPDKKKRKTNTQGSFAPLSEYAPPPNPSADHLVAANPFDDNYNTPSFKPLAAGNPYSSHSHYPGFGGYGPPRMAPHVPTRVPSLYGGPYHMRNQLHPFAQNQMAMGFSRAPSFNYTHHEHPTYGSQASFTSGQAYRSGPVDAFGQIPPQGMNRGPNSDMGPVYGPEGNTSVNLPLRNCVDPGASFGLQQNSMGQQPGTLVPKLEPSDVLGRGTSRAASPQKRPPSSEEATCQNATVADIKAKSRSGPISQEAGHASTVDKLNGVISPDSEVLKNSPQPCGSKEVPQRGGRRRNSGGGGVGCSKAVATPSRLGPCSADPLYPCGICLREVNDDQEAIMCEASCQKWFHRICTGMTETAYNLLTAEASAVWGCDACMEDKGAPLLRTRESVGPSTLNSEGQQA